MSHFSFERTLNNQEYSNSQKEQFSILKELEMFKEHSTDEKKAVIQFGITRNITNIFNIGEKALCKKCSTGKGCSSF